MTVHVLMPVFNRLSMTQSMLEYLRAQHLDEPLSIIVVNDGSTDGTAEFLSAQADVKVLPGDGTLWWGGAIDLGLKYLLPQISDQDWILLVNNDTKIEPGFVQILLDTARQYAPAAVGSIARDIEPPYQVLSVGPHINTWRLKITDILDDPNYDAHKKIISVGALSGRGVLYPALALRKVKGMRVRWAPHYLADYELALRVHSAGWKLLVNTNAVVYSTNEFGNQFQAPTLWQRLFSARSPEYMTARLKFWWSASNSIQRVTMPLRALIRYLFFRNRKKT